MQRGNVVYGALPEVRSDGLGTWQFVRGQIASIKPVRDILRRTTECKVTVTGDDGQSVELLGSQVRWRGPEVFTSTPVSFTEVAMSVRDELVAERDRVQGQLDGTLRRPYDFSSKTAQAQLDQLAGDIETMPLLAGDLSQLAASLESTFDYPQQRRDVHGSSNLYTRLMSTAMGRLPFYEQLALCVLDGWQKAYGDERTHYSQRSWMPSRAYHVLPNIAHLAVKGCAVGPEALLTAGGTKTLRKAG